MVSGSTQAVIRWICPAQREVGFISLAVPPVVFALKSLGANSLSGTLLWPGRWLGKSS
jgi:hypothetical protein